MGTWTSTASFTSCSHIQAQTRVQDRMTFILMLNLERSHGAATRWEAEKRSTSCKLVTCDTTDCISDPTPNPCWHQRYQYKTNTVNESSKQQTRNSCCLNIDRQTEVSTEMNHFPTALSVANSNSPSLYLDNGLICWSLSSTTCHPLFSGPQLQDLNLLITFCD